MTAKWKLKTGKTWREKLEKDQKRKLVTIPRKMQKRFGRGKMLISTPLDVDALVRKVPARKLVTMGRIRARLARKHKANVT